MLSIIFYKNKYSSVYLTNIYLNIILIIILI